MAIAEIFWASLEAVCLFRMTQIEAESRLGSFFISRAS